MPGWAWPNVADGQLRALLEQPMRSLQTYLATLERKWPTQDKCVTTDATPTLLSSIEIPVNTTRHVSGIIVARRTGGAAGTPNDGAGYRIAFVAKNTAGTAALIGALSVTADGESQAGWNVTAAVVGNAIQLSVTGALSNTVSWSGSYRALSVED
jgi:hypothetical protein